MSSFVPILAALAGACVYGVTGVLQQRAAHGVKGPTEDQAGLIKGLISNRAWIVSTLGSVVGFGLQGLALGTGPIALVQPLLVTGILFAALAGFVVRHTRPDWQFMGALGLTAGGLAVFLAVARPTAGNASLALFEALPLGIALVVLLVASLVLGLRTAGLARSLSFALAAGLVYGVTAAVVKVTIAQFGSGVIAVVTHWSFWAFIVLGPLGFLLNQNAFREGKLASPALAVITVTDPLVGLAIGLLWLAEGIATGPLSIAGEAAGLVAMVVGVWLVAHLTPHVAAQAEDAQAPDGDGPTATSPTATSPTATSPTATSPTATRPTATGPATRSPPPERAAADRSRQPRTSARPGGTPDPLTLPRSDLAAVRRVCRGGPWGSWSVRWGR